MVHFKWFFANALFSVWVWTTLFLLRVWRTYTLFRIARNSWDIFRAASLLHQWTVFRFSPLLVVFEHLVDTLIFAKKCFSSKLICSMASTHCLDLSLRILIIRSIILPILVKSFFLSGFFKKQHFIRTVFFAMFWSFFRKSMSILMRSFPRGLDAL